MRYIVQVLLLIVAHLAYGADYVREKKWADEITPGIVVGDLVYLEGRAGHTFLTIYTAAPNAQAGLVIVHGTGVHPDHGLIGTLRSALVDHGYTTLSVQMPILAGEARPQDKGGRRRVHILCPQGEMKRQRNRALEPGHGLTTYAAGHILGGQRM